MNPSEISEFGRIDTATNSPELYAAVCQSESRKRRKSPLNVQQIAVRLELAERKNREVEDRIGCWKACEFRPSRD